ncbi:ABC transporter permease [Rhizobium sp. Root1203]|nr:ABC transporter permease [Rhizobium sp. Root1203]
MSSDMADQSLSPNARRAVVASTVGTVIEWYDYAIYGAASGLVINKLFFSSLSPAAGVLAAFATFAVGFFVRPLGGIGIAHIGDRFGRKPALMLTIILMAAATVGMGLLPTYQQVGLLAPILLVFLRLVQGLGAGAELAGAITIVAEYAPPNRRCFYTAIPSAATVIGILMASLAFLTVSYVPEETLLGWAWRIPFLFSGVLFLVAVYIRQHLNETPEYVEAMEKAKMRRESQAVPIGELFRKSPRELLFGFLSVTGHNANAYILSAFALSYMTNTLGMARSDGLIVVVISSICGFFGVLLFGRLADRIGSAQVYMIGAAAVIILAFPMFALFETKNVLYCAIGMGLCYTIGYGAMAGGQGAFLANLFPTKYRFTGIAMSRELSGLALAGPTPFIAASLVEYSNGKPTLVAIYLIVCSIVTIAAVLAGRRLSVHT